MSTREQQDLVICEVMPTDTGWDIRLGPEAGDPWVSMDWGDFPVPPEVGDIVTVLLPRVVSLVSPEPVA